ncbi:MAG: YihY/virulence factor BrkB family protein [Deltaproteobacteria bacterium]|nr:YihY/virulence factor BrkB family protein [Deltaproteobacteria bacterium]
MGINRLLRITTTAASNWWEDNCMRLAASLAYYTALSLAPLVLIIVGVAGLVMEKQMVAEELEEQFASLIGRPGQELVHTILTSADPAGGGTAALVGVITLIIGATAVFGELQAALNLIWEVKPKPISGLWANIGAWLRQRFLSLAIVFSIAFLLVVSLVVSAGLATAASYFRGAAQQHVLLGHVLELFVSIPVITFLFALLFKYVPDAQIRWSEVWTGAFVSAVLFTLGKAAITYYIGRASIGVAYGAAGSLVVLLVWVYYSSLILFFGAEFTQASATSQRLVKPKSIATPGAAPQTKSEAAVGG